MSSSLTALQSVNDPGQAIEATMTDAPDTHEPAVLSISLARNSLPESGEVRHDLAPPDAVTGESTGAAAPGKLSRTNIILTMTSLCLSALLSALDMTVVTTAVPAIVASLESTAGYIWVGSAFILGFTAVTPIWGSVADFWGRRPIILTALAVFLAGSLLCALAPQMDALIAGRAVQGVGASGMGVMVNTIICDTFSLRDRGFYLAITSIIWAVGSALGPVLGGVITTRLNWRWCFWINLPLGAAVFVVLLFFLKVPSPNTSVIAGLKAIDWTGSAFCVGGALMVLLGLDFGGETYSWSSTAVICLLVIGAAVIGVFLVNEWKIAANPIIPLRLLSSGPKAAAYGVFSLNAYVLIGFTYYLPLYSQSVLGSDALTSGLYLLPLIVSCSLSAACAGVFIQRTGRYRPLMYAAQVLTTLGAGLFIDLEFEKNIVKLVIFEMLVGVGIGLNIEAPVIAAQASTTVCDTAAVVATMGFLRSISTAVSVIAGGVIFQNVMRTENWALVDQLGQQVANQFDGNNASASIENIATLPDDQQVLVRQAYYEALRTVWIMYVVIAGLASVLTLFVPEYHLSTERKEAVLGVDRGEPVSVVYSGQRAEPPTEMTRRHPRSA